MDARIAKLTTTEECANFENNAAERGRPDLAAEARRRGIAIRAENYGSQSEAERDCLEAVYAYERGLTALRGKTTRASRTWPVIKSRGVFQAVEQEVIRETESIGIATLRELGLEEYSFESVVLRHPEAFSPEAVKRSQARMDERLTQPDLA